VSTWSSYAQAIVYCCCAMLMVIARLLIIASQVRSALLISVRYRGEPSFQGPVILVTLRRAWFLPRHHLFRSGSAFLPSFALCHFPLYPTELVTSHWFRCSFPSRLSIRTFSFSYPKPNQECFRSSYPGWMSTQLDSRNDRL